MGLDGYYQLLRHFQRLHNKYKDVYEEGEGPQGGGGAACTVGRSSVKALAAANRSGQASSAGGSAYTSLTSCRLRAPSFSAEVSAAQQASAQAWTCSAGGRAAKGLHEQRLSTGQPAPLGRRATSRSIAPHVPPQARGLRAQGAGRRLPTP